MINNGPIAFQDTKFSDVVSKIDNGFEPKYALGCAHSTPSPVLKGASEWLQKGITHMYTVYHFETCVVYTSDEWRCFVSAIAA